MKKYFTEFNSQWAQDGGGAARCNML